MLGLLIAATEPSRGPFYVAGAVLAAWAVVLATVGIRRASFPDTAGGERGVILVSLVLVVATMAAAVLTDP